MREVQVKEKAINGATYKVTPLGVAKGKAVLFRLNRVLGPSVAASIDAILSSGGDPSKISIVTLAPAWRELVERLTESDFNFIVDTMSEETYVAEGTGWAHLPKIFEFHFRAAYDELLLWLVFCLEVNYGSFLAGLKRAFSKLDVTNDKNTSQLKSPST